MPTLRRFCALLLVCGSILWAQSPPANTPPMELSLEKAIEIALAANGNTKVQLAQESIKFAKSHYAQVRSDLLPRIDGTLTEQNQTVNVSALGIRFPEVPGFTFETVVGPFWTFDVRPRLEWNVFNLGIWRRTQAARSDVHVAEDERNSTTETVAGSVARLYASALRASADVETSKANLALAESLLDITHRREGQGEATGLDVTRAELSVSRNQQKLLAAQTALIRADLDLINVLNIDWSTRLHLGGQLGPNSTESPTAEDAVQVALKTRSDFALEEQRLKTARLNHSAAQLDRLPSIHGYADWGVLNGVQTHIGGAQVILPLFDSRIDAERAQALSAMRQQEIRQKELRNRVELEVRQALASLASAQSQLRVTQKAMTLAEDELARARRLFEAGLANNTQVVDAQERLENARNDHTAAQFEYTSASIDLAQAMGTIKTMRF